MGVDDDERGLVTFTPGLFDGTFYGGDVVAVADGLHVPAVGLEASSHVFGEGEFRVASQTDMVAVVTGDKLSETEVTGQGSRLGGHPFHEIPVAHHGVGAVVDDLEARTVEPGGQVAFGNGHADAVGETLAEGARGGLDAAGHAQLRVAGGLAAPLPEILQLLEGDVEAREVEDGIEERRGVPGGEEEAVAVRPQGAGRD